MSTKNTLIILAIVWGVVAFFYVLNTVIHPKVAEVPQAPVVDETSASEVQPYVLAEIGLQFEYPGGADGYTLVEVPETGMTPAPIKALRLLPATEYRAEQDRVGGEGSPSWMLYVFANDQKLQPAQWVNTFPQASNIGLALTELSETVVGGANAVAYRTDGLYPNQIYVIAHGGYIFLAQVAFMDETARTYDEHHAWIDSFTFVPTDAQVSGKLDPRVACESALAYMTFENGEAADAFIEACVAGEHPEVIERYTKDMGLDGAAI